MDAVDWGVHNPDLHRGQPAVIQFGYKFKLPWLKVAEGMIRMQDYEPKTRLTSTARVEQLDEDRLVIYRRSEFHNEEGLLYDQIVINR